jgi:N-acetylglucosaminyldiphosphoundecaprenol N-acetyl-beta-D-mannosaminyltransferase
MITPLIREYHPFRVNFVLLGGSLQGLNRLSINLKASFPELKIIGTYPRFFLEQKPEDIKTIIRKSEPHVFFVGIGEGDDEIWIEENRELIPKTVAIGVNKQIEIMCHDIPDIPFRYKANNREFVYRLKRKPYRIFDLFIWVFVWGRWRWFLYKLKKTRKGAQI